MLRSVDWWQSTLLNVREERRSHSHRLRRLKLRCFSSFMEVFECQVRVWRVSISVNTALHLCYVSTYVTEYIECCLIKAPLYAFNFPFNSTTPVFTTTWYAKMLLGPRMEDKTIIVKYKEGKVIYSFLLQ
jgi:hypothetical protein